MAVAGFVEIHGLKATTHWTTDDISNGVQNALICVEMLVASIAHIWAFDYKEFEFKELPTKGKVSRTFTSFVDAFNIRDIATDVYYSFFPNVTKQKETKSIIAQTKGGNESNDESKDERTEGDSKDLKSSIDWVA